MDRIDEQYPSCKIEHVISDETFEAIKRFVAEHSD